MEKEKYYTTGLSIGEFKQNADLTAILKAINDIHAGNIKAGFELKQKYKHSADFRPDIYSYDNAFIDILFSNDIPKLLKDIVGRDLYLAHMQLRISYKGESYMSWHRDTHGYGKQMAGNMPPAHKIIFYPTVGGEEDKKIKVIPGSHRRVFKNRFLDYMNVIFSKKQTIKSSDSKFMLFNTELFHHVVPEKQAKGSFRLIYSFLEKDQLEKYGDNQAMIDLYQEKLK